MTVAVAAGNGTEIVGGAGRWSPEIQVRLKVVKQMGRE